MGKIEDFRAKQQKLIDAEKELRKTQEELNNKNTELENARHENEDKKSELIEELLSEINTLKENAKNYEEQIALISAELATLRTNFSNISQSSTESISEQTTTDSVSDQPVSSSEQTTTDSVSDQPAPSEQTTTDSVSDQPASSTEQTTTDSVSDQPASSSEQTTSDSVSDQPTPSTEQTTQRETQSETTSEINLDNYEGFDRTLSQLIFEIEGCAKTANYSRGLNKSGKETLKTAKAKLKQYKDIIEGKQQNLKHEFKEKTKLNKKNPDRAPLTLSISAAEINELKNRRTNRRQKIEIDIKEGQNGKSSNIAPWPNQSIEQIKKGNRVDSRHIAYDAKLNEALSDAAFLRIIDNNQDIARQFLQAIANNSLSDSQITFCQMHMGQLSPYFEKYGLTDQVNRCIQTRGGRIEMVQGNPRTSVDFSNMDRGETFQQGGIVGIVDKALSNCKNMTPGQRNAWRSVALLGGVAAGIFGLYKFFTNKKMGFWGKALTTGGVIFASQALTGENPIALFQKLLTGGFTNEYLQEKFGGTFGDAVNGLGNSGIESSNTIAPAMYSMMIFNSTTTVGNIREQTNKFKADGNEWKAFRGAAITKLKSKYGDKSVEHFSTTFGENFEEQKRNNRLASFGVTDSTADNTKIYELANNAAMNEVVIEKFRTERGVKETSNSVKKKEFEDYVNNLKNTNQAIDIAVLEKHPEWFELDKNATYTERPEDLQNKESLANQVEALGIDAQKKSELKIAVQRFYDERTIENKPNINDFNLKIENNSLILASHNGHEAKIDLDKKEIVGFGNGITFSNLLDLLNAADIANKVLESQKGKLPKDLPAFQYKPERKGICFNNASSIWQDIVNRNNSGMDTRVLSTGWWGATSKIENLSNYPNEYADYLSKRRIKENKINVDSSQYPIVKKLSDTGINFTNQQEIKDLEDWLKGIQKNLEVAVSTPKGNPFSITFTNKLEFKAVNEDTKEFPENISEKFPTLLRTGNKEKFLKMMNDPNNKMRGLH